MEIASIFSGIGGLDIGFAEAGFKIQFANEWNLDIANNYKVNLPNVEVIRKNFRDIDWNDMPFFEGIIGAPAVAPFYLKTPDGEPSLLEVYIDLLKDKQPAFVCFGYNKIVCKTEYFRFFMSKVAKFYSIDYIYSSSEHKYVFFGIRKDLEDGRRPAILDKSVFCERDYLMDSKEAVYKIASFIIPTDLSYKAALAIKEKLKI